MHDRSSTCSIGKEMHNNNNNNDSCYHYHQVDKENFRRCSKTNCDVTRDRLKKYQLLRSKEDKVIEKYENVVKVHDSIAKRRQSIDSGYLKKPVALRYNRKSDSSPIRMRRFSVPNKPRSKINNNCYLQIPQRLDILNNSEIESHNVNPTLTFNNIDTPPNHHKRRNRKISVSPTPIINRSPVLMKKLSLSMEHLPSVRQHDRFAHSTIRHRAAHTYSRYYDITDTISKYRDKKLFGSQQRYLDAKHKYETRKSLLTSLDMDIHKVALILRKLNPHHTLPCF